MKTARVPTVISTLAVAALLLSGCGDDSSDDGGTTDDSTQLANPASEHCVEQGGTVDNRETAAGEEGICVFPDGTEVDEWDYFNGDAEPTQP
jgi:putative hemolysin